MTFSLNKKWQIKKTDICPTWKKALISAASIVCGLLVCAVLLLITGNDPIEIYEQILISCFDSVHDFSEIFVEIVPLILCSLGVSIAFKMKLWNIGAEGQFYMGAFGATFFALYFPYLPWYLLLPLMALAGIVAGGVWGLIPAIPKAFFNVNETISTLLFNYIAMLLVTYFVLGPWKDPKGKNFPLTAVFVQNASLPIIPGTRIDVALLIAVLLSVVLFIVLQYSKWGYEVRVSGFSKKASDYAGMHYIRNVLLVMFVSGAICGFAGMSEVSGVIHRLQQVISPGYGNTAIIIALLARLSPIAILPVSFLMAILIVGGYGLQTSGFSTSIVYMFQGTILFFVLAGEFMTSYKISRKEAETA